MTEGPPPTGSRKGRTARDASRGRVVMLVDNDVSRDSRVQKQARSMSELGWDVVLLGLSRSARPRRWRLGGARVRLVTVPSQSARRSQDLHLARLRSPLAYPISWLAERRQQTVEARTAELRVRRIETAASSGSAAPADRLRLLPARGTARAAQWWVGLRSEKTARLRERRDRGDAGLDRLTTAFWQRALGDRVWRRFDPELLDLELAYGPVIDRLRPDLLHANDFRMLGVASRAVVRASEQGRRVPLVWDAHEFLPGIRPWQPHPRWHLAMVAHEREFAGRADAVVTVSEELADLLVETHGLRSRPTVVLNAPPLPPEGPAGPPRPGIREACGIGPDVPLMVYSGVAAPQRGLDIMVEALPQLHDVVCAFVVSRTDTAVVRSLVARAEELGVADRLRLLPYVPFDQVVPFLASADVGVIPLHHWPNHEIALITKFFEYSHARLPLVVSDVRAMAETTRATGQGEVFAAEDLAGFVTAVRTVLADPERYRAAYTPELLGRWTWEAQAAVLDGVYGRLLADV